MSVYPSRYQLPELSAHLMALLERRRAAFATWDEKAEEVLLTEAKAALDDARRQFLELADDPAYWERTAQALLTIALPRYFRLAKQQHGLESARYGLWRGGDLVARVAYAALGLVAAAIVWRTAMPKWVEPLPVFFFLFGPLIPDFQVRGAKRRYRKGLAALVEEMRQEEADRSAYQPLGIDDVDPTRNSTKPGERGRTGA